MQTGGSIIGQGSYGCVFDPPLNCDKNINNSGKVGKVTSTNEANHEYSVGLHLKTLPYATDYFILADTTCIPNARSKQTDKTISECKTLKSVKIPTTVQLILPFGGRSLVQIKKTYTADEFYNIGRMLLEAGTLLLLGGVVHSDIHSGNVVMNGTLKIIDYGKAWFPKNLVDYNDVVNEFNPKPMAGTPEENIISAYKSNINIDFALAKITDEKTVLSYIYKLTGKTSETQINELREFMRSSLAFREKNWNAFYKIYWKKLDAWGIGSVLIINFINTLMFHTSPEFESIVPVILGLCSLDPGLRLDCTEALELWAPQSKILEIQEVQTLLQEQKNLRNGLISKIGTF
jgi:tRNA A-37 threonylcarbamoyl transferase component Bud32